MGGAMKYFLKKIMGHEIFRSVASWTTKKFFKNLLNPPASSPRYYILNVRSLMLRYNSWHVEYTKFKQNY